MLKQISPISYLVVLIAVGVLFLELKPSEEFDHLISSGEQALLRLNNKELKEKGTEAIAQHHYSQAVDYLERAWKNSTDPETLIYLNNARIGDDKAREVAISVPIDDDGNTIFFGMEMLRGYAQFQDKINDNGGINGTPLKLTIVNDQDDPRIATELANKLAEREELLAVTGHWSSSTSLAAVPIYDQNQLPFVAPVSTNTAIAGMSDYVFRTVPDNTVVAETMVDYATDHLQAEQLTVFFDSNSTYSLSLKRELTTTMKENSIPVQCDFNQRLIGNCLNRSRQKNVDALVLIPGTNTISIALHVINANSQEFPLIGDIGNLYGIRTLEAGGNDAVGMAIPLPWHIEKPKNQAFVEKARKLWGGSVNWATAMTYDAMSAIAQGLKRLQEDPTREGLKQALSAKDFSAPGVVEPVEFLPSGDRDGELIMVEVQPRDDSRSGTGYDFVPIASPN